MADTDESIETHNRPFCSLIIYPAKDNNFTFSVKTEKKQYCWKNFALNQCFLLLPNVSLKRKVILVGSLGIISVTSFMIAAKRFVSFFFR
nr:hypothetical protein [Photorhabdus noenieputensis]